MLEALTNCTTGSSPCLQCWFGRNVRISCEMQDEADDVVRPSAANPRRTRRVQFTCNLCGETTTKMVNPHAWDKGTVFAQCSGCDVKHKLIGE